MKTVVELRQLAKELKIKVPAGTAKNLSLIHISEPTRP